jgi:hypothetical protein
MSIKFNDTQLVLLNAASERDDRCLMLPTTPKRNQAQRTVPKLLEAGLVKEIRPKAGAPIWRRDEETLHSYALKLTAAGAKAIAVDDTEPSAGKAEPTTGHPIVSVDPKPDPVQRRPQPLPNQTAASPIVSTRRNQNRAGHRTAAAL